MPPPESPDQAYSFITNPPAAPRKSPLSMLSSTSSIIGRAGLIGGGLLILFIIILILKGLFGGGGIDTAPLLSVAQDQQEMLKLSQDASTREDISASSQEFIATTQLAMASSQSQLIKYIIKNHKKVSVKQLYLKASPQTTQQLDAAATNGTYDQTFQQIMQDRLATYEKDLQAAYQQDKGKKGRALLQDTYNQAKLLQSQLTQPAG